MPGDINYTHEGYHKWHFKSFVVSLITFLVTKDILTFPSFLFCFLLIFNVLFSWFSVFLCFLSVFSFSVCLFLLFYFTDIFLKSLLKFFLQERAGRKMISNHMFYRLGLFIFLGRVGKALHCPISLAQKNFSHGEAFFLTTISQ